MIPDRRMDGRNAIYIPLHYMLGGIKKKKNSYQRYLDLMILLDLRNIKLHTAAVTLQTEIETATTIIQSLTLCLFCLFVLNYSRLGDCCLNSSLR